MAHVKIFKGDKFLCRKNYKMECGEVAYKRGNTYVSEVSKCITDQQGDVNHQMESSEVPLTEFNKHFIEVK